MLCSLSLFFPCSISFCFLISFYFSSFGYCKWGFSQLSVGSWLHTHFYLKRLLNGDLKLLVISNDYWWRPCFNFATKWNNFLKTVWPFKNRDSSWRNCITLEALKTILISSPGFSHAYNIIRCFQFFLPFRILILNHLISWGPFHFLTYIAHLLSQNHLLIQYFPTICMVLNIFCMLLTVLYNFYL